MKKLIALFVIATASVFGQEYKGAGTMFGDGINRFLNAGAQTVVTKKVDNAWTAGAINGGINVVSGVVDTTRENNRAKEAAQAAEIGRLRQQQAPPQQVVMVAPPQPVVTHAPLVIQQPPPAPSPQVASRPKFVKAGGETFQEGRDAGGNSTLTPVNVELISVGTKWYQKMPNGVLVHVDVEQVK